MKKNIEARHETKVTTEHKIVFSLDGKKYGFRCDDQTLERMECSDGQTVPKLKTSWATDGIFEDFTD